MMRRIALEGSCGMMKSVVLAQFYALKAGECGCAAQKWRRSLNTCAIVK
jgi:hypothetical protein